MESRRILLNSLWHEIQYFTDDELDELDSIVYCELLCRGRENEDQEQKTES